DSRRYAEGRAGNEKREDAPDQRHRDNAGGQQRIGQRIEIGVEQHADQRDGQWNDEGQPLHGVLQIAEFADPFQMASGGQGDLPIDLALRFQHRPAEVAPAHAEFDGNVALLVFAVNEGRAGDQIHFGYFAQGNLHDAITAWARSADGDMAYGVEAFAVF